MTTYSDSDSSDESDRTGLLKKALDVSLPDNFDPNKIPETGEEYLQKVMYERKQCKKLVTANVDTTKFVKNRTKGFVEDEVVFITPPSILPPQSWQLNKQQDFEEFRKFVQSQQPQNCGTVESFDEETFLDTFKSRPPKFNEICEYSQEVKTKMIQLITKYLMELKPGEYMGHNVGTWLYGLLSMLQLPLSPHTCDCIRKLAKVCIKVRSTFSRDCLERFYAPLNLFICIVARSFSQLDLADH